MFESVQFILIVLTFFVVMLCLQLAYRAYSGSHDSNEYRTSSWRNTGVLLIGFLAILLLIISVFTQQAINNNFTLLKNSAAKIEKSLGEKLLSPSTQEHRHQEVLKAIKESLVYIRGKDITSHQLEVILEKYLSNTSTQEHPQKEVLEAIDNIKSDINSRTEDTAVSTSIFGIAFFVFVVSGVLWFVMKLRGNSSHALGFVTLSALLTTSFSIADKIFDWKLVENVSFTLFSFSSKLENGQGEKIPSDYSNRITLSCPNSYTIAPFVTGKDDTLEYGQVFSEKIQLLVNRLTDDSVLKNGELLILIGSADRRPLGSELINFYGSNAGLAQARAMSVKTLLKQHLQKPVPAILVFSTGPNVITDSIVLPNADYELALANDRSVRLCTTRTEQY